MPVTKSAIKALRKDRARAKINLRQRQILKKSIKEAREKLSEQSLRMASRQLDMAVKKGIIHPNKEARLKSRLARLVKKTS